MSERRNVLGPRHLLLMASLIFVSAACDQVLEVTNPGDVTEEGLQGEEALPVVVNGVYGDFQDAYDEAVEFAALFTDELIHSGSFPSYAQVDDRAITPPNVEMEDLYTELGTTRFTADRAVANIREVLGADAESSPLLAMALAFAGYSRVVLADNFCQVTIDVGLPTREGDPSTHPRVSPVLQMNCIRQLGCPNPAAILLGLTFMGHSSLFQDLGPTV